MLTLKFPVFLLLLLCLQNSLSAQDKLNIKFGKVRTEDFNLTSALIDSGTSAVVVAEVGKSTFFANASDLTFSLIYVVKRRIKIIKKNGFEAATVTIPLYVGESGKPEKMEDLNASTYNIENGNVVETKVDKSSIFTEKHSKNWIYKKFTFPALKEGSIIEYTYEVKSDYFFNLQSWTFQGEYPVMWSQYEAEIPEFFKYAILSQGYQPFVINKVNKLQGSFSFVQHVSREGGITGPKSSGMNNFNVEGSVDYHTWIMKDVPALKEEAFTTTLRNSIAKIEFQLKEIVFPNSNPTNYMNNWEKVAKDLMADEQFGGALERSNNWLEDDVRAIVKTANNQIEKCQKIFEYVRDNFTCINDNSIYLTTGLKDVFKNKNGSVSDINMLLIAMLRVQNIIANPVILSTRDHGTTHEFYPLLNRYNYVISKVVIADSAFYLDATIRQLAFGRLPLQVYNGQAREIGKDMADPVYFVADSLKETGITSLFISNTEKGGVGGSFTHNYGVYEALDFRNKMTKTVPDDLKKLLLQEYPEDIAIDNILIDSLKILNEPVGLMYDLKFNEFGQEDIVYFTPMLSEAIKKNPFIAAERYYPVEMPYTFDDIFAFNMEIPKGYKIEELPKSVRFNLNEDEGMFEYLISADKNYVQMRCRLILKKATFLNEDYPSLREFYSLIVKKESEQIVFKKIK